MNDLKTDPSGGMLSLAKEADPRRYKYKSFLNLPIGAPYRRSCPYLISAVYSGCLIKSTSQYFNRAILATPLRRRRPPSLHFIKIKVALQGP